MKILAIWCVKEDADFSNVKAILFAWHSYLADELREHYESDFATPAISII